MLYPIIGVSARPLLTAAAVAHSAANTAAAVAALGCRVLAMSGVTSSARTAGCAGARAWARAVRGLRYPPWPPDFDAWMGAGR